MKDFPSLLLSRCGLPTTIPGSVRNAVIPETGLSSRTNGDAQPPFAARRGRLRGSPRPATGGWGRPRDDVAIGCQLIEPDLSGVALGDRVRGQEPDLASVRSKFAARRKK